MNRGKLGYTTWMSGRLFTFSVSSSSALTSWIILCISCEGMAEMTEWAQVEVTAVSSWDPPSPRSIVHSLSVAKLCLKRWKHIRDGDVTSEHCSRQQCITVLYLTSVLTLKTPYCFSYKTGSDFFFNMNPLPYEYKTGAVCLLRESLCLNNETLQIMFTQTSLWKSYLTENPLSALSGAGSDSWGSARSTAEGSCGFGERGLPWHGYMGGERIKACETWNKNNMLK